jgi:hypothetical protein
MSDDNKGWTGEVVTIQIGDRLLVVPYGEYNGRRLELPPTSLEGGDDALRLVDRVQEQAGIRSDDARELVAGWMVQGRARSISGKRSSGSGFSGTLVTSAELESSDVRHRWLVKRLLVRDQPAIIGGPRKATKTLLVLDFAVNVGSGKPFLGVFPVETPAHVAVFSGESGQPTSEPV